MHIILLIILFTLTLSSEVIAGPFDRFLMPGELTQAHAKYEKQCEKCHTDFDKTQQDKLCLQCHKTIHLEKNKQTGFHGKNPTVSAKACKYCHTDHIGRKADIRNFNQYRFDHDSTDYPLKLSHKKLKCASCHKPNKKNNYRIKKHACVDCHKKNDIHEKRLGNQCNDCHKEKSWDQATFDHDKTKFKLNHKHKKVTCALCHPNQIYKNTPRACYDCHQLDDIHQLGYGKNCKKCHGESAWDKILFNHDKDTKFKLRNGHRNIKCSSCHKRNPYKFEIDKTCVSCHTSDDKHNGLFGEKCQACHNTKQWSKSAFKHDKDTDFSLFKAHRKLKCIACHKVNNKTNSRTVASCYSCHKKDDVHQGSQGENCVYCHQQSKWHKNILFDHDLTRYPLIGSHVLASCEACHSSNQYVMDKSNCQFCHENEDIHQGQLGENCELCHSPSDWQIWHFSHDEQTDYKLEKAHQGIDCLSCHKQAVKNSEDIELSKKCFKCHELDDKHYGNFGKHCEKCHRATKFSDLSLMDE